MKTIYLNNCLYRETKNILWQNTLFLKSKISHLMIFLSLTNNSIIEKI